MLLSNLVKFWGFVAIFFIGFFWFFYAPLLPFILGLVLAYILNPAVDLLERNYVNRLIATNIVLFGFIASIIFFFLLFVPIVSDQIKTFVNNLPLYQQKSIGFIDAYLGTQWKQDLLGQDLDYQKYVTDHAKSALGITENVISHIFSGMVALIKSATLLMIIPVVAFYFLMDWYILVAKIKSWLPQKYAHTIIRLVREMNNLQSGFIRGQVMVCLIQAFFYIVALSFIGVDYSITLGFVTGVLTFIPYIGASIGFILVLMISLVQFLPNYYPLIYVCMTFAVGQVLEGYVWIPKIVGGSVALHPLWVMFALLAFGSIWGLSGMLVAVPVTAGIGVLARFAFEKYRESIYFTNMN